MLVAHGPSGSTNAVPAALGVEAHAPDRARPVVAENLRAENLPGRSRVACEIDGETLWFETTDGELAPSWEAIGSALLLPALLQHRPLHLDGHVCGRWLDNSALLLKTVSGWWDVPRVAPGARSVEPPPRRLGRTGAARRRRPAAQCFTGGVDSFFTAFECPDEPEVLVVALGYDVPLADEDRTADVERRVRAVGGALGREVVVIRTNLRTLGAFGDASWPQVHGGALAALGHLLSHRIGRLVISASCAVTNDRPWGSHWRIDHRWSSGQLAVAEYGERRNRFEKVEVVAGHQVALDHLLICFQRSTRTGNCSRCPKCLATMVMLDAVGALDRCATLEPELPPATSIDAATTWRHPPSLEAVLQRGTLSDDWRMAMEEILAGMGPRVRTSLPRRAADRLGRP